VQSRYPNESGREKSGCRERDPPFRPSMGERCQNMLDDRADEYRKAKALVSIFHAVKAVKHCLPARSADDGSQTTLTVAEVISSLRWSCGEKAQS
jgi:hypothetical protein